jgi:hypothetical protein
MSYLIQFIVYTSLFVSFVILSLKISSSIQCRNHSFQEDLYEVIAGTVDKQIYLSNISRFESCLYNPKRSLSFSLQGLLSNE